VALNLPKSGLKPEVQGLTQTPGDISEEVGTPTVYVLRNSSERFPHMYGVYICHIPYLVGGLEHVIFFHTLGTIIPFDEVHHFSGG
jgi:hypothetical protein